MDPDRWRQVEELYHAALEKNPDTRAAFLQQACGADAALREEVESLLSFAGEADGKLRAAVHEVASQASSQQNLGRYRLIERIGKGGMGVVYRAIDPAIGRVVAIKTILFDDPAGKGSEQQARLLRESQAGGRLSHPNIVAVHDICQQGPTSYIVMEYVQGRTLDQAMRDDPSLRSSGDALRIVRECAAALDYAHAQGVIHRDIKPANIMLQAGGVVKIADFGIAKVAQSSTLTQGAVTVGSPEYMAPEQWRGQAVTGQADQYALATVAYLLLTGRRPFEGESLASLAAMTLYEEPPAAVTFNSQLKPAIDRVLLKALSKKGEGRYPSCNAFAIELQRAWDGAPVRVDNRRKWILAVVATALLAGVFAILWPFLHRPGVDPELRGEELSKQNDFAGAVKYFTQAIAVKPDYSAYFGRAGAYQRLEQREKAIADYSEAIRLKPDSAQAYHDRAVCEVRLDRVDDAIHDYDRALELDPANPRTWNGRGAIYLKKGGYKKAINCFSKAIELDPKFIQAYVYRAAAEKKLPDNAAAEADLKQAGALRRKLSE